MKKAAGTFIFCLSTKRFLFNLRSINVSSARTWGIWGGWCEGSESLVQTVIREVIEETGFCLYSEDVKFLHDTIYEDGNRKYSTFITFVDYEFEPVLSHESDGYRWTTLEERPEPLHYGIDIIMANKSLRSYLKNL